MNISIHHKRPYVVAAAIWLFLVAVFFWPIVIQNKVLAPLDIMDSLLRPWADKSEINVHNSFTYDAISQYLPYNYSAYNSLRADGYIGWDPYTHSGTSNIENTMLCPGDWHHHLFRFMPFWDSWNLGIIIQFSIAGMGILLLLREQKIPAAYALIGVIVFGFYSQFTLWIYHRWTIGAMCWSPWIIWALIRAKADNKIIHLPSIAFIALAFRGGNLQTCVFIFLLVLILAAVDWWESEDRWKINIFFKILLPYILSGLIGSLLALDVFIETIPSFLTGGKEMPPRTALDTLLGIPTLITSLFPTIMGTPQGIDLMKVFKLDLYSIKFIGAVPLILASIACFSYRAATAARALLIIGIILPFTPADRWLYSRFTIVFALGAAWLAAWYLHKASQDPPKKIWKYIFISFCVIVTTWLLASTLITFNHDLVEAKIHEQIRAQLPADKSGRLDWMLARGSTFLAESMLWSPRNLLMLSCIGVGIFGCSRVNNQSTHPSRFALIVAMCAFGELLLFSSTWLTFSSKPKGDGLYENSAWISRLRAEVGNGAILCYDRSDFDYLQLNTPSSYGLRFAEGYETVTPQRIDPDSQQRLDPKHCAAIGISHIIVAPEKDPGSISGWERIQITKEYILYKNPIYQGIAHGWTPDNNLMPIPVNFKSPNQRELIVPINIRLITVSESYNAGWQFSVDTDKWNNVEKSDLSGMRVLLDRPTKDNNTKVLLRYKPTYRKYYQFIITLTILTLTSFSIYRYRKSQKRLPYYD